MGRDAELCWSGVVNRERCCRVEGECRLQWERNGRFDWYMGKRERERKCRLE